MEKDSKELPGASSDFLGTRWFDPIEVVIRDRVRVHLQLLATAQRYLITLVRLMWLDTSSSGFSSGG